MDKEMQRLLRGEIIGLKAIVDGSNLCGTIVDETKNSLIIETEKKERKAVLKANKKFHISFKGNQVAVEGDDLIARPEDRIKIKVATDEKHRNQSGKNSK